MQENDFEGESSAPILDNDPESHNEIPEPLQSGLPRSEWLNLEVSVFNAEGDLVGAGVIRNCEPADCVDNSQLGLQDVGVLILESILPEHVPADWKYSVRRWPCTLVKYRGTSLFDLGESI